MTVTVTLCPHFASGGDRRLKDVLPPVSQVCPASRPLLDLPAKKKDESQLSACQTSNAGTLIQTGMKVLLTASPLRADGPLSPLKKES